MLELQNVRKTFEDVRAVDDLSFRVETGDIYGLLGPNGAGKTTTIRMIMQIFQPDSGSITFQDEPITVKTKDRIGYLPEERGVYQKMKVNEVIEYFAALKDMDLSKAKKNASKYLERFDLLNRADDKIEELSKGNQQKVQFIISIIHDPKLLILDEPFSGLDPVNQILIKEIIQELREEDTTILFSTHQMAQVEKLCERICLINEGKVIVEGNLKKIKRDLGSRTIRIESDDSLESLKSDSAFSWSEVENGSLLAELQDGLEPHEYLKSLVSRVKVRKFEVVEPSLEQIFIDQVRGGKA